MIEWTRWLPKESLEQVYKEALELATELTKDNPKLFRTTFQCIFWEGCHYLLRLKLRGK